MKVTEPPVQMDTVAGVMLTDGVTLPTVTVTALLVAAAGLAQASLPVITTVTASPLFKVVVVKVVPVCPATLVPFTCHW